MQRLTLTLEVAIRYMYHRLAHLFKCSSKRRAIGKLRPISTIQLGSIHLTIFDKEGIATHLRLIEFSSTTIIDHKGRIRVLLQCEAGSKRTNNSRWNGTVVHLFGRSLVEIVLTGHTQHLGYVFTRRKRSFCFFHLS